MTDSERITKVLKISMEMLAYGIKIEDTKETTSFLGLPENYKVYFSIPETSTMYDDNEDAEFNAKLKTTDGLTEIAKQLIIETFMCGGDSDMVTSEDLSSFIKFYVKVRSGETWTKEQSDEAVKEANKQIEAGINKLKAQNGYKEV